MFKDKNNNVNRKYDLLKFHKPIDVDTCLVDNVFL